VTAALAGGAVAIVRLTLTDFRSYGFLRLETDARPVVLTGPNGAGKTNVLEALSFLTPGRGLRRARMAEVSRRDAGPGAPWAVAAAVRRPEGAAEIGVGREAGSERRVTRIDGRPARSQAMLGDVLSAVWLTPVMDRLFTEGAAGRRRFLDRLAYGFDTGHAGRLSAYEHALRERARLLKAGRADPAWLDQLEGAMAENGIAAAQTRRATVDRLTRATVEAAGPFPAAALAVTGVEDWLAELDDAAALARLRQALAASRRRDAESGGAAEGPHRSDLKVRHLPRNLPAEQCSTGEQKALLVSIVLAQARARAADKGVAPILLLDEVAAHLDRERRTALFDELTALGAQSWLTGTDPEHFAGLAGRAQFFHVADSVATRVEGPEGTGRDG
jgi:DNA replication and repair protein RecF